VTLLQLKTVTGALYRIQRSLNNQLSVISRHETTHGTAAVWAFVGTRLKPYYNYNTRSNMQHARLQVTTKPYYIYQARAQ